MHTGVNLLTASGLLLPALTAASLLAYRRLADRRHAVLARVTLCLAAAAVMLALGGCGQFDGDPDEGDICSNPGETVTDEETGEVFVCGY
jgi:hypothetical protein